MVEPDKDIPHIFKVCGKSPDNILEIDFNMIVDAKDCINQIYSYLDKKDGIDETQFAHHFQLAKGQSFFYLKELTSKGGGEGGDLSFTVTINFGKNRSGTYNFTPTSDMDELVKTILNDQSYLDKTSMEYPLLSLFSFLIPACQPAVSKKKKNVLSWFLRGSSLVGDVAAGKKKGLFLYQFSLSL